MEINVSFIQDVVGSWLYRQYIQGVNIVNRALGDVDKNGDGTAQIQQGMHLYCTFLVMEFSPGIQAEAQVNGRTVKSIDHIVQVNPEIIVVHVQRSCLLD